MNSGGVLVHFFFILTILVKEQRVGTINVPGTQSFHPSDCKPLEILDVRGKCVPRTGDADDDDYHMNEESDDGTGQEFVNFSARFQVDKIIITLLLGFKVFHY